MPNTIFGDCGRYFVEYEPSQIQNADVPSINVEIYQQLSMTLAFIARRRVSS